MLWDDSYDANDTEMKLLEDTTPPLLTEYILNNRS